MGIELELCVLLILQLVGTETFARFEVETPVVRKVTKWLTLHAITVGLFYCVGHYCLLFPLLILMSGIAMHLHVCKKHGFDPIKATPRKKYYQFRGWKWKE